MNKKIFSDSIDNFKKLLLNRESFAFNRFSDGELYMMQNKPVIMHETGAIVGENIWNRNHSNDDFKEFIPGKNEETRLKLIDACKHNQYNYYRGISCSCCVGEKNHSDMLEFCKPHDEFLTWANAFLNANYPKFVKEIVPIFKTYEVIIVCNESADLKNDRLTDFNIVNSYFVQRNAVVTNIDLINKISNWIKNNNVKNKLFLFSASALSKLLIHNLYKNYPDNTYIDIGTTMHPYLGLPLSRDYLRGYWSNQPGGFFERSCIW